MSKLDKMAVESQTKRLQTLPTDPEPAIERLLESWLLAERQLKETGQALDSFELDYDMDWAELESRETKLIKAQARVIEALSVTPSATIGDIEAKLRIWKASLAPNMDDLSGFTPADRLGILAVQELSSLLKK
ncbi:MAG: hypothetical protein AAF583_04475 [Pseudomonadota bacterium]